MRREVLRCGGMSSERSSEALDGDEPSSNALTGGGGRVEGSKDERLLAVRLSDLRGVGAVVRALSLFVESTGSSCDASSRGDLTGWRRSRRWRCCWLRSATENEVDESDALVLSCEGERDLRGGVSSRIERALALPPRSLGEVLAIMGIDRRARRGVESRSRTRSVLSSSLAAGGEMPRPAMGAC